MTNERKRRFCFLIIAVVSWAVVAAAYGDDVPSKRDGKPQTICPVMGGKIDKSAYVDYEGNRVYFCCSGCKEAFLQNPEKYMKKMESQGILLDRAPDPGTAEKQDHR